MKVKQKNKESVAVCCISGEINLNSVSKLQGILKKIIFDKQRKVLLNLKDVEYIDSSGFAFLIQFSEELKSRQGVVFFSNLSPKIRSLFAITKLDSVFKLYETEQEALKDFYGY